MTNPQTEARAIARKILEDYGLDADENFVLAESIATVLAAKDAELAVVKRDFETLAELQKAAFRRAERAEAQLAEANKALEEMQPHIDKIERCIRVNDEMGRVVEGQTEAAKAIADIARRAIASGGKQ